MSCSWQDAGHIESTYLFRDVDKIASSRQWTMLNALKLYDELWTNPVGHPGLTSDREEQVR